MNGKVHVKDISTLDNLMATLDRLGNSADSAIHDKDNSLKNMLLQIKTRVKATNDAEQKWKSELIKWNNEYEKWKKEIIKKDKDGHSYTDNNALMNAKNAKEMASKANKNAEQCRELYKAARFHQEVLNKGNQMPVLNGYNTNCRTAKSYINQLRQHIQAYHTTDGVNSFSFGWAGNSATDCATVKGMAMAQDRDLTEKIVNGRTVLQREIDWNYVFKGKTNLERALSGKSPYDKDGGLINLHHFGQEYDGTLVEVPTLFHLSKEYNLHEGSNIKDGFRNDPSLDKEYENYRKKYWENRAIEHIERNGR